MGQRTSPVFVRHVLEAQERERRKLLAELSQVKGLMPLLMKHRNGVRWTLAERAELADQLHALAHLSPYLVLLAMPGSVIALPMLAWWLDRRRQRRGGIIVPDRRT